MLDCFNDVFNLMCLFAQQNVTHETFLKPLSWFTRNAPSKYWYYTFRVTLIISWSAPVNLTHARQVLLSIKIYKYSTSVHFDVEEN